jgi:3-hydroxyisobutyrate dehydrogenase-like beta-hydroxyacid dehydrogenase
MTSASVGIVGLGLMGSVLAERLMSGGHAVSGFDVDAARMAALKVAGGEAASLHRLMTCTYLVLAVYDETQALTIVDTIEPTADDVPTVICATTCSSEAIERIANRAAANGVRFIEAPISGTSVELRSGDAMALIAGDEADIDRAMPVLQTMCPRIIRAGRIGDASRMKLAINLVLQSNRAALAEGMVFARTIGLDPTAFLRAVSASTAYSRVMDVKGEKMLRRDFTPQSRIAQTLKDANLIIDAAHRHGLELPMTSAQRKLLEKAIAVLGEDVDSSAVIAAIESTPES